MHAFICTTEVAIENTKFFRRYPSGKVGIDTPLDKLILDTGGESKPLRDHFEKLQKEKDEKGTDNVIGEVTLVMEKQLLKWEHLPARLGRISAKLLSDEQHGHDEELEPLPMQCDILKSKKPTKKHFRFAVVSGFGANLGDCTIGMTAMRIVAELFARKFESFAIDFLLGPAANSANADIVGFEPWVEGVFFESPSLQDFARYDGYFDFTGLTALPKFNQMPMVDWYMWWMGLNPDSVPANKKRNKLTLYWEAWHKAAKAIKNIDGKRVWFSPKASVPLRSLPPESIAKFVKKLLEADTKLHLITNQKIDFTHKRLIDLTGKVDSIAEFEATVAQLDGVITVDSFPCHLADACSVPTISIHSSIPAFLYPYYPYSEIMLIPDAENLSGWHKSKLETEEQWQNLKEEYIKAWDKLSAKKVLKQLDEKITLRNQRQHEARRIQLTSEPPKFKAITEQGGFHIFKYDFSSALWKRAQQRLSLMADNFLKAGMSAVLVGAGQSDLPVALAKKLGGLGTLHIFEPRSQRRALISADIVSQAVIPTIHWYENVPLTGFKKVNINDVDPFGETTPEEWGNLKRQIEVPALPIDKLKLGECHLITVMPPMPWKMVIDGAMNTIREHRPILLFAPIPKEDAHQVVSCLKDEHYQFWAEPGVQPDDQKHLIMLGFPDDKKVNLTGFARINLK